MVDRNTFFSYIARVFRVDQSTLSEDTRLRDDLGATSQALFTVSALMEKLSGKAVSYADVNGCDTLGEVLDLAK